MRRRPVLWAALLLLAAVATGALAWRYSGGTWPALATEKARAPQSQQQAGGASADRTVPVEAVEVSVETLTSEIRVVGSLLSNESVVIRPEVSGRVAEILFEEGQRVEAGMPLLKLDATIASAEVDQAQAALALSQANHKRAVELFERKAASAANRDQTLAALRADQAVHLRTVQQANRQPVDLQLASRAIQQRLHDVRKLVVPGATLRAARRRSRHAWAQPASLVGGRSREVRAKWPARAPGRGRHTECACYCRPAQGTRQVRRLSLPVRRADAHRYAGHEAAGP